MAQAACTGWELAAAGEVAGQLQVAEGRPRTHGPPEEGAELGWSNRPLLALPAPATVSARSWRCRALPDVPSRGLQGVERDLPGRPRRGINIADFKPRLITCILLDFVIAFQFPHLQYGGRGKNNICLRTLSVQFSSVAQSCSTLCDPMNRSTPGLPVHHQLPEFT